MYKRDIPTLCRLGFSLKEAADQSPMGYIKLFERLEPKAANTGWVREILISEKRAYMARFVITNDEKRRERDRDIILALTARRRFASVAQ